MNAEVIATIVAVGTLATAAAGWLDAKTKAIKAENKAKEIEKAREQSKIARDEEVHKLKTRLALVEKDCKLVPQLIEKIDAMNGTLIALKTMAEFYFNNKKDQNDGT